MTTGVRRKRGRGGPFSPERGEVYFTTGQVANILNVTRTMVCRHIREKKIPVRREGSTRKYQYLLPLTAVEKLIETLPRCRQAERRERLKQYLEQKPLLDSSMLDEK